MEPDLPQIPSIYPLFSILLYHNCGFKKYCSFIFHTLFNAGFMFPEMNFHGSWSEFFDHFVKGDQLFNGDPYEWYLDWHNNKGKGEVLYLKFEDMKQDLGAEVRKIADFLGIKLSESHVQNIVYSANFKQMKSDHTKMATSKDSNMDTLKDTSTFVRKGACGEWKKYFTVEQNEWFDSKYKKLYEELDVDVDYN